MEALKPCPFCGGKAELHDYRDKPAAAFVLSHKVNGCILRIVERFSTEDEAVAAWNRRPPAAEPRQAQVKALSDYRIAGLCNCGDCLRIRQDADQRRSALIASPVHEPGEEGRTFEMGQRVTKTKGSSWTGRVVGFYSTSLTPVGYCVESENEPGSVQIYPEAAITSLREGEKP